MSLKKKKGQNSKEGPHDWWNDDGLCWIVNQICVYQLKEICKKYKKYIKGEEECVSLPKFVILSQYIYVNDEIRRWN